ncbi:MAG: GntR family transcriptional regulator [Lachnospiraceae bacterium]|nr:GntR family transcriptional regulator [Lachnospiraceae bacterium]
MKTIKSNKPKYEVIKEELLDRIRNNDFSHDKVFCTEKLLSEQYQVSNITAKRAITDLEQEGLLYRKRHVGSFVSCNAPAKLMAPVNSASESKMIAFLLPFDVAKGYFPQVIETANTILSANGYLMSLYISDTSVSKERAYIKSLIAQDIAGLIFYPVKDKFGLQLMNHFIFSNIPVVMIDKVTDNPFIHNVVCDNFEGGRLLTEHLIGLGHRNIAFITTIVMEEISSVRDRFSGYIYQLKKSDIMPNLDLIVHYADHADEDDNLDESALFRNTILRLYQSGATAIIAENDHLALQIYHACRLLGLRVPEDLSICGFDHTEMIQNAEITSIKQDFSALGEQSCRILLSSIKNPKAPVQKITLPVELMIHSSTGAPRHSF